MQNTRPDPNFPGGW